VLDRNVGQWTVLMALDVEVLKCEKNPLAVQIIAHETANYQVRNPAAAQVLEFTASRYARGCLAAYLRGENSLTWILGAIRSSKVRGLRLANIFEELKGSGDSDRYLRARTGCADEGWL